VSVTLTASTATAANTISQSARVKQGNENTDALVVKTATITAWTAAVGTTAAIEGVVIASASNHYWDFM